MKINLAFDLDCDKDDFIGYSTWLNSEDVDYAQWCRIKDEVEQILNAVSQILEGAIENTTYGCEEETA